MRPARLVPYDPRALRRSTSGDINMNQPSPGITGIRLTVWQITLTLIEFQERVHFRRRGGAVVFGNEPPLLSFIRCQNHLPQFHPNAL